MQQAIGYFQVIAKVPSYDQAEYDVKRQAIIYWATANNYELIDCYVEIAKDVRDDWPVLLSALNDCKKRDATLLLAILDKITAIQVNAISCK